MASGELKVIPTDPDSIEFILSSANIDWQEYYEEDPKFELFGYRQREHDLE